MIRPLLFFFLVRLGQEDVTRRPAPREHGTTARSAHGVELGPGIWHERRVVAVLQSPIHAYATPMYVKERQLLLLGSSGLSIRRLCLMDGLTRCMEVMLCIYECLGRVVGRALVLTRPERIFVQGMMMMAGTPGFVPGFASM